MIDRNTLSEILLKLSLPDLARFCSSNKDISDICRNRLFWRLKVIQEFPTTTVLSNIVDWENFYKSHVKYINVKYENRNLGKIMIYNFDTFRDILLRAVEKFNLTLPIFGYLLYEWESYSGVNEIWDRATTLTVVPMTRSLSVDFDGDEGSLHPAIQFDHYLCEWAPMAVVD